MKQLSTQVLESLTHPPYMPSITSRRLEFELKILIIAKLSDEMLFTGSLWDNLQYTIAADNNDQLLDNTHVQSTKPQHESPYNWIDSLFFFANHHALSNQNPQLSFSNSFVASLQSENWNLKQQHTQLFAASSS